MGFKNDGVYVKTADGDVRFFKNTSIRMSTNGVLCITDDRDYNKIIHAFPEGSWKEASTEKLYS